MPNSKLPRVGADVLWGIRGGLFAAVTFSVLAAIGYDTSAGDAFRRNGVTLSWLIAWYVGSGIAIGALVGLLQPITQRIAGQIVVGIVGGMATTLSGWLFLMNKASWPTHGELLFWIVAGATLGSIVAIVVSRVPTQRRS